MIDHVLAYSHLIALLVCSFLMSLSLTATPRRLAAQRNAMQRKHAVARGDLPRHRILTISSCPSCSPRLVSYKPPASIFTVHALYNRSRRTVRTVRTANVESRSRQGDDWARCYCRHSQSIVTVSLIRPSHCFRVYDIHIVYACTYVSQLAWVYNTQQTAAGYGFYFSSIVT